MKRFLIKEIRKTKDDMEFIVETVVEANNKKELIKKIQNEKPRNLVDINPTISELKEK